MGSVSQAPAPTRGHTVHSSADADAGASDSETIPLSERARRRHWQLLAGFLAAACLYVLFLEPWGHDTWYHLQRLLDVERQFGWGHLRAYFADNAAQGKGLPVWIYYSQWIYWPPMVLTSLGVGPLVALKLAYCVLLVVCCAGCYRLLRIHVGEDEAVFGTLLFITSNYVIGEVFQRSAYAELTSVVWLPWLLWATHRNVVHQDRWGGAGIVLFASLMILSHPLSFMNAGCAVVAYAAYVGIGRRVPLGRILSLLPFFALALGMTAFYWLPALVETHYVLGAEGVPTPFRETFLTIGRYLKFSGVTTLGLVLTAFAPVVAACALRRARTGWPLLAGIVVYILLTLRLSEPLYTALPVLASNLWVWRVLFPMTLLVVIFVTVSLDALPQRMRSDTVVTGIAALAVLQATALVLWNTATDFALRPMDARKIEAEVAVESRKLRGFGIDEYLPQPRVLPHAPTKCHNVRTVVPDGRYSMSFTTAAVGGYDCIYVRRYWNTRYRAWIDGVATPVYANGNGEILLVPYGRTGTVSLLFTSPGYVTVANVLSGISVVMLLIGAVRPRQVGTRHLRSPAR